MLTLKILSLSLPPICIRPYYLFLLRGALLFMFLIETFTFVVVTFPETGLDSIIQVQNTKVVKPVIGTLAQRLILHVNLLGLAPCC